LTRFFSEDHCQSPLSSPQSPRIPRVEFSKIGCSHKPLTLQCGNMRFLHWLNEYANAFLALLTFVYVALTYRMLKALRRESTREHRLRHLEDIKAKVARPLREWLTSSAIPVLEGKIPPVFPGVIRVKRPNAQLGEHTHEDRLEMVSHSTNIERGGHLFKHTQDNHFPTQFNAVEYFISDFQGLLNDFLEQTEIWASAAARATTLPRVTNPSPPPGEFADSDYIAALYLRYLISGNAPELKLTHPVPDATAVKEPGSGRPIAQAETRKVRSWLEASREIVERGWKENDFAARTRNALTTALLVREYLARLELTYDLGSDCEYVGGQRAWNFGKLLRAQFGNRVTEYISSLKSRLTGNAGGQNTDTEKRDSRNIANGSGPPVSR
jgi:hypothetical protein